MLGVLGVGVIAVALVSVVAGFGKIDWSKKVTVLGYTVEYEANVGQPFGLSVTKK